MRLPLEQRFDAANLFRHKSFCLLSHRRSSKEEKKSACWASSYIKIRGKSNIRFENADRDR